MTTTAQTTSEGHAATERRDPFHAFLPYPHVPVANASGGPLTGLRLAVKDLFDVAGYRTGCGCPLKLAESPIAQVSAPAVERLLAAGAGFVGKTHTDELAWSLYGMNAHFGTPVNPTAPDRIPGGSSSGSAVAVAGNLADVGLGSDTGGSVRAPASFCGIWGLRPTHGRSPLGACMELAASFDSAGVFARDGSTLLAAARALLDPSEDEPVQLGAPRLASDMFARIPERAQSALLPLASDLADHEASAYGQRTADELYDVFKPLQARDAVRALGAWIERRRPPLGPGVGERYRMACMVTEQQEQAATAIRAAFRAEIDGLLVGGPLLAPAVHDIPFRLDAAPEIVEGFRHEAMKLLCVAGLAGLPQVVFPAATIDGAPLGLSLIGPRNSDLALVRLATELSAHITANG